MTSAAFHRLASPLSAALLLLVAAPAVFAPSASAQAAAQGPNIGVVDVEFVILNSKTGKAAKSKLKKLFDKRQSDLDTKQDELLALKKKIESPSAMETDEGRKKKVLEYQQGVMLLQEDFMKSQQELAKQEVKLMKPILEKLESVLGDLAADGEFDIIMNRSQQGVIFAKPAFDVTDRVLKSMDAS